METAIFSTKLDELVQYIIEKDDSNESSASVALNPVYTWTKFILTDDKPNENKQRIPQEEFANLIKSGIFSPVKMSFGKINEDHSNASPIGVITHLKNIGDRIEGMAALWLKEREEDVLKIKEMVKNGDLPQLSWEVLFEDSKKEDDGAETLLGTILRGVTIVGSPAYAGRTPIFAAASTNNNLEDIKVDELETLKAKVSELETALADKDTELASLKAEVTGKDEELETLREFKASVEKDAEVANKLKEIKVKFSNIGLEKEDTYFESNKETLLKLDEASLDFLLQEMVAFANLQKKSVETEDNKIPNFSSDNEINYKDPKKLAEMLRKLELN